MSAGKCRNAMAISIGTTPAQSLFGSLVGRPAHIVTQAKAMLNADAHRLRDGAWPRARPVMLHEDRDMMHVFPPFPTPEARRARTDNARALAR
jgi:hypothetical protein